MEFDILEITADYYAKLNTKQRKFLRDAQKKKNELIKKAQKEIALYRRTLYTNSVQQSSLLEQKTKEIEDGLAHDIDVIREQLLYDISVNAEETNNTSNQNVGYRVDYTLSYLDRYIIVRDYYLSIPDPEERLARYLADDVAKKYLDIYYNSLYNVLLTYS